MPWGMAKKKKKSEFLLEILGANLIPAFLSRVGWRSLAHGGIPSVASNITRSSDSGPSASLL